MIGKYCRFIIKYAGWITAAALCLMIVAVVVSAGSISFNPDWSSLIPESIVTGENRAITRNFPTSSLLQVVIKGTEPERMIACLNRLVEVLASCKGIAGLDYRLDEDFHTRYGLFLADDRLFSEILPYIKPGFILTPVTVFNKLLRNGLSGLVDSNLLPDESTVLSGLEIALGSLSGTSRPEELARLMFAGEPYYFSPDHSLLLLNLFITASSKRQADLVAIVKAVQQELAGVQQEYPELQLGLTGIPALETEVLDAFEQDMLLITLAAFLLILIIQFLAFRNWQMPLQLMLALLTGIAWTFLFLALTIKTLNTVTSMFVPILLGLGIDFGIHFSLAFKEAAGEHRQPAVVLEAAFRKCGKGILIGAVTTALAFYTLCLTGFRLYVELGLLAGTGILCCLLAVMLVLPALLSLFKARSARQPAESSRHFFSGIIVRILHHPLAIVLVAVLAALGLLLPALRTGFDTNSDNIRPRGLKSFALQEEVSEQYGYYSNVMLLRASSLAEAERLTRELKALPDVGKVLSVTDFLADRQRMSARKALLRQPSGSSLTAAELRKQLEEFAGHFPAVEALLEAGVLKAADSERVTALRQQLSALLAEEDQSLLKQLKQADTLFAGYLAELLDLEPLTPQALPAYLKTKFISRDSTEYLLYVFAAYSIMDAAVLGDFIAAVKPVTKNLTGLPLILYALGTNIRRQSRTVTLIALVVIILVVMFFLRSLKYGMLAFSVLLLTLLGALGIFRLAGQSLNFINILALPLIVGIAIDGSIHIITRYMKEGACSIPRVVCSTGKAVALTTLTTVAGFSSLIFNLYRGVQSLGWLLILGFALSYLLTIFFLPAVIELLDRRRGSKPSRDAK